MKIGVSGPALLIWLLSSMIIVLSTRDPLAHVVALGCASTVAALASDRRPFRAALIFGSIAVLLRTLLFALTGHEGENVLVVLPSINLGPAGSLSLGGPITSEVVTSSLAEGLRFLTVIAIFGAFVAVSSSSDLLRLVPAALFEAALVLNISLVFAPQLVKTAAQIKEAQQMRGAKRLSLVPSTVIPMLALALERSFSLAESMEARGFGTRSLGAPPWIRFLMAFGSTGALLGLGLWSLSGRIVWMWAGIASGFIFAGCLRSLSRRSLRTRYRVSKWSSREILTCVIVSAAALLTMLHKPDVGPMGTSADLWSVLAATTVIQPALLWLRVKTS